MIDNILIAAGLAMAVYGFIGLVGVWLVPAIGSSRLYGAGMLTGRMEPTRVNRTVTVLWALLFGMCLASLSSGHRTLGNLFLVAFSLCAVAVLYMRHRHGR
ncbi:hypothetical protein PY254_15750 [Rhodanobacter sp. AS-Z3]|uniref:hypothetical protein n=1 Tax=Rhodanobacter sp. AS-Z3 TaxID=3031330 RepID=UPI00247AAF9F|nr:hypothetical protein [Rhodanobacter sp. AS-Z3]WEN14666.1 hypothetical protein PY254_15750 [Rhodanobacter sp. AS-Z3]